MNYEYFDKIICINLKERPEKKKIVQYLANKHNIPLDIYEVDKHIEGGMVGCFDSHLKIIRSCYENNFKNVLIFEDDFSPTSSLNNEILSNIILFLKNNPNCEYFQLGYTIIPNEIITFFTCENIAPYILKYNGNLTHAYILNRRGMKRILDTYSGYFKKKDLDFYYKEIFKNNGACVYPLLFDQNFCLGSDNLKSTSSYYSFLRYYSCTFYQYSIVYSFSLFRFYFYYFVLLLFLLFFIIYFFILKKNSRYIIYHRK